MSPRVDIRYRRPPDDERVFTQELLLDREDVRVTFAPDAHFESPLVIHDEVVLESGSDVVWFTFPGRWHDVGRFHRRDTTFTGIYANILTPPIFTMAYGEGTSDHVAGVDPEADRESEGTTRVVEVWTTTDLFLDVWLPTDGGLFVLDREQLVEAVEKGWVSPVLAERAREEVARIEEAHGAGRWPPPVVEEWTLERAREVASLPRPRRR
ncbi:MAG: DUF402 domain-containing protein [Gemmatimonadota bacterium]